MQKLGWDSEAHDLAGIRGKTPSAAPARVAEVDSR
jgi:hypothetical protein